MPQPGPQEDLDASLEREDPSRDPTYDEAENDILGSSPDFRSTGENSELGDAGPRVGGGEPVDTRTDAEVTEELKAAAAQRSVRGIGQRTEARTRGAAAAVSGRVGRVSNLVSRESSV